MRPATAVLNPPPHREHAFRDLLKGESIMVLRTLSICLVICGIFVAAVSPAHAEWIEDGTPIAAEHSSQNEPRIVTDGAEGAILMWSDYRSGSNWDVYAQRVDALGNELWASGGIPICTQTDEQGLVEGIPDGWGGAIIVWRDYRNGNYDIYAQRVDASGSILWAIDGVPVCDETSGQDYPAVATDGLGGAIVAWQDSRSAGRQETYAQRVNASGTTMWLPAGVVVGASVDSQYEAMIVADAVGGAYITWRTNLYDIYAQRLNASGSPRWGSVGRVICTAANQRYDLRPIADGTGSLIVSWRDNRVGSDYDIYAQRLDELGNALWATDGEAVCTAPQSQMSPRICSDGSGGAIVSWRDIRNATDYDVYAQRLAFSGAPLWTLDGVAICTTFDDSNFPELTSDGAGGAIVTWLDKRNGSQPDIFAQRVSAAGNTLWDTDGVAVSTATDSKYDPWIIPDEMGGAFIAWRDRRNGVNDDIYAQRIERNGYWGYPAPAIAGARDVPGDQGGLVKLSWDASRLDPWPDEAISHYTLWRAIDPQGVAPMQSAGARMVASPGEVPADASEGFVRVEAAAGGAYYWELLENVTAYHFPGYATTAPTHFDSSATSSEYHYFQVIAHGADPSAWWASMPDSGYSVDNLAPAAPQNLAGEQITGPGGLLLTWAPNMEMDLSHYTIYRGTSAGFVPGPGNLLSEPTDTFDVDGTWQWDSGDYYKVGAVDIHGNESVFAVLGPELATGIDPARAPKTSFLSQNYPNPFRHRTGIPFGLASEENATIRIYDVRGRLVRTLVDGQRKAAAQTITWDGRDTRGTRVAAGIYFYRLEAGTFVQTKKMVVVR